MAETLKLISKRLPQEARKKPVQPDRHKRIAKKKLL